MELEEFQQPNVNVFIRQNGQEFEFCACLYVQHYICDWLSQNGR